MEALESNQESYTQIKMPDWLKEFKILIVIIPLFIILMYYSLERDMVRYDECWHVHMGQLVYETNSLPEVDPYSYNTPQTTHIFNYNPLFHILMAGLFYLFGVHSYTPKLLPPILGVVAVIFVYLSTRRMFGSNWGLFSALIFVQPLVFRYSLINYTDMLVATTASFFYYAVIKSFQEPTNKSFLLVGISYGLLLLSKSSGYLLGVPFFLLILFKRRDLSKGLIFSFFVALLVISPYVYHRYRTESSILIINTPVNSYINDFLYSPQKEETKVSEESDQTSQNVFATPVIYFINPNTGIYFARELNPLVLMLAIGGLTLGFIKQDDISLFFVLAIVLFTFAWVYYEIAQWRHILSVFPIIAIFATQAMVFLCDSINVDSLQSNKNNPIFAIVFLFIIATAFLQIDFYKMLLIEILGILSIVGIMILINRERFDLKIEVKEDWVVFVRMIVVLVVLSSFFYTHYIYTKEFIDKKDSDNENWKVHADDKAAFEWIRENTEEDADILSIRTYMYLYYTDRNTVYSQSGGSSVVPNLHDALAKSPEESSAILNYRDGIDYIVIDRQWVSIYPQYNQWPADFVYSTLPSAQPYYKLEYSQGKIQIYSVNPPKNEVL